MNPQNHACLIWYQPAGSGNRVAAVLGAKEGTMVHRDAAERLHQHPGHQTQGQVYVSAANEFRKMVGDVDILE